MGNLRNKVKELQAESDKKSEMLYKAVLEIVRLQEKIKALEVQRGKL